MAYNPITNPIPYKYKNPNVLKLLSDYSWLFDIFYFKFIKLSELDIMNGSVSTVSGKIKIKIVLLGNQSVGKSSIIDKYVNDKFD